MAETSIRITAPVPPDLDGYLYKLKSKQTMFGSWTKRYFKINRMNATLEYYHRKPSSSESTPARIIDLTKLTTVRKYEGYCIQMELQGDGLMLRAASAAEQSCWITALQLYMQEWATYRQKTLDERIRKDEGKEAVQHFRDGYERKDDM